MSQNLHLRFERDTDGTGELHVFVQRGQYSGAGSAWFSDRQVQEFGESLSESFPLPSDSRICLEGGYWKSGATSPHLEEVLVRISVYAANTTGTVAILVELKEGRAQEVRNESRASVTVELLTEYECLRTLGLGIAHLVHSQNAVVQLPGAA